LNHADLRNTVYGTRPIRIHQRIDLKVIGGFRADQGDDARAAGAQVEEIVGKLAAVGQF
jgi:hypothetical protein